MKPIYKKYLTTAILVWSGCLVPLLLANMLILAPQKKNKKQIEKQFDKKKLIYDSAIKISQEKNRIKLNRQIERLQNGLKDLVAEPDDLADLTFDIGQIANEKKLTSFSIKTKESRRNSPIPNCKYIYENHIDISFKAGFDQFAAFLNALERHRPVVFIDEFKIVRSDKDNFSHQVDMDLAVFVRKKQDS